MGDKIFWVCVFLTLCVLNNMTYFKVHLKCFKDSDLGRTEASMRTKRMQNDCVELPQHQIIDGGYVVLKDASMF